MDFKPIIKEQREELLEIEAREGFIPREAQEQVGIFLAHPNILVVTGVRRCGKSVFSYLLVKGQNFGYINFDDERLVGTKASDLNDILQAFYELYGDIEYIVLDEIQNVEGWELFANRLRRTKKVIVTGSNSRLLAGEMATHLTGRYMDIQLTPFSYREFLEMKGFKRSSTYTTKKKAELMGILNDYMRTGGLPEVHKFGRAMIQRIYDDIITKDIIIRHHIRKKQELKKLARYLITGFSNEITYSKLSKILDIKHVSTVSNWVSYLKDAFLIIVLERFNFKLKQQFNTPKKVYCIDNGIVTSIGFNLSENRGRLMENMVAVELHRICSVDPILELFYWKDHQQNEVDFIIKTDPGHICK